MLSKKFSIQYDRDDFIIILISIIIVIILLIKFPGNKPEYIPTSEAEFLSEHTAEYSYDESNKQYRILFEREYTDYIGSKEIDSYMSKYRDSELEQYVSNLNSPLVNYKYKYGIYDDRPSSIVQHDESTGWKSIYYIDQIIIVDDSYFDISEYNINSFVKNINESYYTYADYIADYDTKHRADIGGYYLALACKGFFFFLAAICITTPIVRLITDKFF